MYTRRRFTASTAAQERRWHRHLKVHGTLWPRPPRRFLTLPDVTNRPIGPMNSANGYHLLVTPGSSAAFSGTYVIKKVHSGLILGTSGGGTGQGTLAVQATASGSSTQAWTLVQEGSGFYEIKNSASGLLLGIQNMSIYDGGDALIWGTTARRIACGSSSPYLNVNTLFRYERPTTSPLALIPVQI